MHEVTEDLYPAALRRVPPDTISALTAARDREEQESARPPLPDIMVQLSRRRAAPEEAL
jgi:hypothetical protein